MPLANFGMQPSPEIPWKLAVSTDGTWGANVAILDAEIGQRTELLQVGEIRQNTINVTAIVGCEIYIVEAHWAGRDNVGVGAGDGCYVSDIAGAGSELNLRDDGDDPFAWGLPSSNLFGTNWCIFAEAKVNGTMVCTVSHNVAQLAPLTIPTRKLNKPCNIVDQVLGSSSMSLIPPNIITRAAGDFTTKIKERDDILVRMDDPVSFPNIHGRVKTVSALQIELYAPHGQDSGGVVPGSMVVSAYSDGT